MIASLPLALPNDHVWSPPPVDEAHLVMLAELTALFVRRGDVIELEGDLGAGKSTFARALIRAVIGDDDADVPSPTFSLVQTYATRRGLVTHADLYRLQSPAEADELCLEDAARAGVVLVEWPDRGGERLGMPAATTGDTGLKVELADGEGSAWRVITLTAFGDFKPRFARMIEIWEFLQREWSAAVPMRVRYLQGDASARRFARLEGAGQSRVLMDAPRQPDGPPVRDGLPYSRIAHLAEDLRPFVAIAAHLADSGELVPAIRASDLERGLLLVDDLGSDVFQTVVGPAAGGARRGLQHELWSAAVDALIRLRSVRPGLTLAMPDGSTYVLPRYDASALAIEVELLLDWLWPAEYGAAPPAHVVAAFRQAWMPLLRRLAAMADGLVLRDFHSANLLRVVGSDGVLRIGIIDFQDAVLGPVAYDLVSLLQDARVDVPGEVQRALLDRYLATAALREPGFDRTAFEFAYAGLGVQRNTKILGIFARLSRRDGKHAYLAHMPRLWVYLEEGLAHPDLGALKAWYEQHWPRERRRQLSEP